MSRQTGSTKTFFKHHHKEHKAGLFSFYYNLKKSLVLCKSREIVLKEERKS